jgi:hypothetical protein
MKINLPRQIFEIENFMKIRLLGSELFRADRQTDGHDEANSHFPKFCGIA